VRLARLQQALTLGALALGAAWALLSWRAGQPGWALAGVAAVTCGHAAVLAFELLLARVVPDPPEAPNPAPRPRLADWLRAWAGEIVAAPRVFCWQQPFRSRRWPDHLPRDAAGRRGVLLVHGFFCNRGFWNDWLRRLTAQGTPVVAVDLEPAFAPIEAHVRRIDDALRKLERATGLPPVVVAHSMGGLVLRRWWADVGSDERVHHAITLGTPHHGTWLARWAFSANTRQMRLNSAWLRALRQREPASRAARFTCFVAPCDNVVFPAGCALLPGAGWRLVPATAHVHLATRPETWDELQRRLGDG
jgi:hypothetical protein